VAFTGSHAALLVGAGILTWKAAVAGTAGATFVSQWGTAYVGSHVAAGTAVGKAAIGLGTVVVALNYVDEATVSVLAAMGDCNAVGEWTTLRQLGAADGPFIPFGDMLAAGGLLLPGRRVIGEVPWSSPTVRRFAADLQHGATSIHVPSRAEAEELFLRLFQGSGYRNSTSLPPEFADDYFGGKVGTYHWDEVIDVDGRLAVHKPGNPDAQYRHLQIHTSKNEIGDGRIIRIFYGPPLVWP
jgi:hypothetical protein